MYTFLVNTPCTPCIIVLIIYMYIYIYSQITDNSFEIKNNILTSPTTEASTARGRNYDLWAGFTWIDWWAHADGQWCKSGICRLLQPSDAMAGAFVRRHSSSANKGLHF